MEEPNCDSPPPVEKKSPFEEELPPEVVRRIKSSVPPVLQPPEKFERGFRTKKSAFQITKVDIYAEANIGELLGADTTVVTDTSLYPKDFVYMIHNHGDFTSEEKRLRFPFHIKTYLINQNR